MARQSIPKEIGQGAEATITILKNPLRILKNRLPKKYRHPTIDKELRKTRTRRETKILQKVPFAPKVLGTDNESKIEMEYIKGNLVRDILDLKPEIAIQIGKNTGELHDLNIMHGDLTTSNMILSEGKIKFIDFGLSIVTHKVEDKAVDLHLFREAIESKHYKKMEEIWNNFLKGYNPSNKTEIIKRLQLVEKRGRNKEKY